MLQKNKKMTDINYSNILSKYLLLCCFFVCITSLPLSDFSRQLRIGEYSTTNSSYFFENITKIEESTTTESPNTVIYRLLADNGTTCILMKTDAVLGIGYVRSPGEETEHRFYLSDEPQQVTGDCINEDVGLMAITLPHFKLKFRFEKILGGERWYLDRVELAFDTEGTWFERQFDSKHNKIVHLSTGEEHSAMLFPTPMEKSYTCSDHIKVNLLPVETRVEKFKGFLKLRSLRLQPFMYKNDFGPPFECSVDGYMLNETAPLAVGATLPIAILYTIIYRLWSISIF